MAWFQANFTGNFWPFQPPKIWKLKEELYFDSRCQPRIKFGGSNNLPISNHSLKQTAQSDGWPCWKVMSLRSQIVYVGQMEVAAFNLTLNYISIHSFQNYGLLIYLPKGREQWSSAWLQSSTSRKMGSSAPETCSILWDSEMCEIILHERASEVGFSHEFWGKQSPKLCHLLDPWISWMWGSD